MGHAQTALPITVDEMPVIRLTHYGGKGLLGYDADGNLWTTFERDGLMPEGEKRSFSVCAICDEPMTSGYMSGVRNGHQRVCCRHIEWQYDNTEQAVSP